MTYGSKNVIPFDDEAENELKKIVNLINEIGNRSIKMNYFRISPAIEDYEIEGGWGQREIPDAYRVSMLNSRLTIPILKLDDLIIEESITECLTSKSTTELNISEELFKYASKIAKSKKVKASLSQQGKLVLDARDRSKSVFQQITDARDRGDECIYFDPKKVTAPTVRVYVSGMNYDTSKDKIRVSMVGGLICVRFKERNAKDSFVDGFKTLLNRFSHEITPDEIFKLVKGIMFVTEPEEEEEF